MLECWFALFGNISNYTIVYAIFILFIDTWSRKKLPEEQQRSRQSIIHWFRSKKITNCNFWQPKYNFLCKVWLFIQQSFVEACFRDKLKGGGAAMVQPVNNLFKPFPHFIFHSTVIEIMICNCWRSKYDCYCYFILFNKICFQEKLRGEGAALV